MNGKGPRQVPCTTTLKHRSNGNLTNGFKIKEEGDQQAMAKKSSGNANGVASFFGEKKISFMNWSTDDVVGLLWYHPIPCVLAVLLLFFMNVEYTLLMIPPSSPPFDLGFVFTRSIHRLLASSPALNTLFAALNTVFVGMQTAYILWTWLVEGRPRATIAALSMFPCRGILGYTTQLPLPQDFLGSGVDFPVGNVSFFLFYSGHVAGAVIASLDMRRMQRWKLAWTFDVLNILQGIRLLGTRGHYTIDLAVGVGAGILFDSFAGKYIERKRNSIGASATTDNLSFSNS